VRELNPELQPLDSWLTEHKSESRSTEPLSEFLQLLPARFAPPTARRESKQVNDEFLGEA
jgi:hypothetical protein